MAPKVGIPISAERLPTDGGRVLGAIELRAEPRRHDFSAEAARLINWQLPEGGEREFG